MTPNTFYGHNLWVSPFSPITLGVVAIDGAAPAAGHAQLPDHPRRPLGGATMLLLEHHGHVHASVSCFKLISN